MLSLPSPGSASFPGQPQLQAQAVKLGLSPATAALSPVPWTRLISSCARHGHPSLALAAFHRMLLSGPPPDPPALAAALSAAAALRSPSAAARLHALARRLRLLSHPLVAPALARALARSHRLPLALSLLDETPLPSLPLCTALVSAAARAGHFHLALLLFRRLLLAAAAPPDAFALSAVLPACARPAAAAHAAQIHAYALRRRLPPSPPLRNALLDAYLKSGRLPAARRLFLSPAGPPLDRVARTAMAHGLALHGRPRAALRLIRRIPRPDAAAFYAALKACHVSCLAAPARALFLRIRDPRPEHVVLFAGALARAGQLAEAAALAAAHRHLRVEILRAVIDGCRIAGDLQLGRSTAEQLLELDPLSADNYVLLGNAYAAQGRWKMVEKMREMARDLGLKPSKACSWIELKGKVHVFAVGDVAHPRSQRIRWEARRLMAAPVGGSDPETGDGLAGFALHDVDEERECVVGGHSEILAVVFGVLSTPETALVRVTKNARLSRPCHSAIKRISEAAGREVLLRDPLRFHHFRHGECSCGDVW